MASCCGVLDRSWRACASSEARIAGQSSCTRQAARSFMGSTSACSSSAVDRSEGPTLMRVNARLKRDPPPSTMEGTAPTHLLTMGDRRFRTAALPRSSSAHAVKVSSSCFCSCQHAAPATLVGSDSSERASSSTSGTYCLKSGETTCLSRVSMMAACLSLAVSSFSHRSSAR